MKLFRNALLQLVALLLLPPGAAAAQQQKPSPPGAPSSPGVGEGGQATDKPAPLKLTGIQWRLLHEKQLAFALDQRSVQADIEAFNAECARLAAENQWPEGTHCALDTLAVIPAEEKPADKPSAVSSQPSAKPAEAKQ